MPKIPIKHEEKECPTCGQTVDYVSKVNKGMVSFLKAFADAVVEKGINDIRMKGLLEAGRITHSQYDNRSHLRCHGFIASLGTNRYCLTKKGAGFLRGGNVEAAAIVEKRTHSNIGYVADENGQIIMTNLSKIMKSSEGWWAGWKYDIGPDGSLVWLDEDKQASMAL